jgi:hypothetical protein
MLLLVLYCNQPTSQDNKDIEQLDWSALEQHNNYHMLVQDAHEV